MSASTSRPVRYHRDADAATALPSSPPSQGLHTFLFLKGNQIIRSTIANRGANTNASKKLILVTCLLAVSSVLLLLVVFPEQKLWKVRGEKHVARIPRDFSCG